MRRDRDERRTDLFWRLSKMLLIKWSGIISPDSGGELAFLVSKSKLVFSYILPHPHHHLFSLQQGKLVVRVFQRSPLICSRSSSSSSWWQEKKLKSIIFIFPSISSLSVPIVVISIKGSITIIVIPLSSWHTHTQIQLKTCPPQTNSCLSSRHHRLTTCFGRNLLSDWEYYSLHLDFQCLLRVCMFFLCAHSQTRTSLSFDHITRDSDTLNWLCDVWEIHLKRF